MRRGLRAGGLGLVCSVALARGGEAPKDGGPAPAPAAAEAAPPPAAPANLVRNGGFEAPAEGAPAPGPADWDPPDGLATFWEDDPDPAHGKVIRMDTNVLEREAKAREREMQQAAKEKRAPAPAAPKTAPGPGDTYAVIGATYGVSLYGAAIPVRPGQAYRLTVDFRGRNSKDFAPKVWVRGLADLGGRERRLYDFPLTCRAKDDAWKTFTGVFHPTAHTPKVTRMKVMLFAYWPAGEYVFDNVRIAAVSPEEYAKARETERAEMK